MTGEQAARRAIDLMDKQIGARHIAAIVLEPIQGEGGFIVPAPGFLPTLAVWAHANGIVFVADEVQTGFARTGAWFACEHDGVVPDLMALAKGIASGLPLSAVVGRADLIDEVHTGGLGGTYGGNPVACAAALATLDQMRDLDLCARARHIEEMTRPLERGVVVLTCGTYGNVIRLLPPLVIPDVLLTEGLDILSDVIGRR
jgi:4-aminobutyrate aminotransferase/(S)-3-amino-2-methylpropionate transaminase